MICMNYSINMTICQAFQTDVRLPLVGLMTIINVKYHFAVDGLAMTDQPKQIN